MDLMALIQDLECTEPARRQQAAKQLAQLETDAQPAAVALVRACGAADDDTREWAVAALESLGPPAASDLPALAALLEHQSSDAAYWAATLLGRLREEGSPAAGALSQALSGRADLNVRQRAAWALGQIGPAAQSARDALQKAASDADPRLAALAKTALASLGE
jgi:HEAT repeat protein